MVALKIFWQLGTINVLRLRWCFYLFQNQTVHETWVSKCVGEILEMRVLVCEVVGVRVRVRACMDAFVKEREGGCVRKPKQFIECLKLLLRVCKCVRVSEEKVQC